MRLSGLGRGYRRGTVTDVAWIVGAMIAMGQYLNRFNGMRHMLEKKEGFRRGLATLRPPRGVPEGRNVLRVALPEHGSSVG